MAKGIIKIIKTDKGKITVHLDKLNNRLPMSLSYVTFSDDKLNDKECEYQADSSGRITIITVEGQVVFGKNFDIAPVPNYSSGRVENRTAGNANTGTVRPLGELPALSYNDSLDMRLTKLPRGVRNLGVSQIDNFSLKLNKAARFEIDGAKKNLFTFFRNDRKRKDGRETGAQYFIKAKYGSLNFGGIGLRQRNQAEALFGSHFHSFQFSPDWRLICGLSGGIYETNMTLHHVYGVPFIPASSLKGVVRSWIIANVFSNAPSSESDYPLVNAEYRALKTSHLFCDIFGAPESIDRVLFSDGKPKMKKEKYETEKDVSASGKEKQGMTCFMEGMPVIAPEVVPDIMNPHYRDWYNETALPTDFQSPNPIVFLTVSNNSRFQTCIGVPARFDKKLKEVWPDEIEKFATPVNLTGDETLADLVAAWVKKALSEHGIGAKTATGYGILK
jgi:CRISPR-associated protein Cmr6